MSKIKAAFQDENFRNVTIVAASTVVAYAGGYVIGRTIGHAIMNRK